MNPTLLFVMEIKISGERVEKVAGALGFSGALAMSSVGLSGGIGLFWSADVEVDLKIFNAKHIDVVVNAKDGSGFPWRFTGFYGEPKRKKRHLSWALLRCLNSLRSLPWLCMGDFNETMHETEHYSEHVREEWQMRAFREATEDCTLLDLGFSGVPFTWDNMQAAASNVKVKIDRAFRDITLMHKFPVIKVWHINIVESDHCLLVFELNTILSPEFKRSARKFMYENGWQSHNDYGKIVKDLWEAGRRGLGLPGFLSSLKNMQEDLSTWGSTMFGNFKK
jgi:hypothetical protein